MKILIIYDSEDIIENIGSLPLSYSDRVYLYPLTSRSSITNRLLEEIAHKGPDTEVLYAAQLLNLAADRIRDVYIKFIADIPDKVKHDGKNLKELFAIDGFATLWWFSLVSEKSTFKSSAFNNLAQLDSIVNTVEGSKIEKIVWNCKNASLHEAVELYTFKKSIIFEAMFTRSFKVSIFKRYIGSVFYLFQHAFRLFLRMYKIKRAIAHTRGAVTFSDDSLMIITVYPNIDIAAAKRGIFKNKFYPFLQDALEKRKQNIIWGCMYVENNTLSFDEALRYAASFVKHGYNIYFLEEFVSLFSQVRSLLIMLRSGLRYLQIEKNIKDLHNFGKYNFYSLFRNDWHLSFMNYIGYEGILRYDLFRSALSRLKATRCLYMCEMQGWEKSLETAKKSLQSKVSSFAYQHGSVAKMCLSYFNHPCEMKMEVPYAPVGPDTILCNGQVSYNYIKGSGWPEERIKLVDAIRYNHLKESLKSNSEKKKNVLLLAFSLSLQESSSLLTITWEAFKDLKNTEIWLKPHPFIHIDRIFELSELTKESLFFRIKNEPLGDLLSEARVVIAGESSVSFEALAHGCEVLVVNTCEWINMSPLNGITSSAVAYVNSAQELREKINTIFRKPYLREPFSRDAKRVIYQYFYLNDKTDIPEKFLGALEGSSL